MLGSHVIADVVDLCRPTHTLTILSQLVNPQCLQNSEVLISALSCTCHYAGRIPEEVCVKAELRKLLPSHSLFTRNKCPTQVHTPTPENKKELFELAAKPDSFYCFINVLNVRALS